MATSLGCSGAACTAARLLAMAATSEYVSLRPPSSAFGGATAFDVDCGATVTGADAAVVVLAVVAFTGAASSVAGVVGAGL